MKIKRIVDADKKESLAIAIGDQWKSIDTDLELLDFLDANADEIGCDLIDFDEEK
ncbi:MAG: hypothetical protein RIF33_14275 [Cyclobacteriaceae bacterium]